MPHELFLITNQTTEIRNAFANNISTDMKLSKAQISIIIQLGGSFGSWLGNLGKKALTNNKISLARDNLPGLVSNLTSNAIKKLEKILSEKGVVKAGKRFSLFFSNEDTNDIIKIIKSLEDLGVLIDGVTKTVKYETKKQEGGFLGALLVPLAAPKVQPVISSVVKGASGREVRRTVTRYMEKNIQFRSILKAILRLLIISITNLDLIAFFHETIY